MRFRRFIDYKDWKKRHLSCPHIGLPADRSTVSRTRLCFWSVTVCRCMWKWCPLGEKDPC